MKTLSRIALLLALNATASAADRYRHAHTDRFIWIAERIGYELIGERTETAADSRRCGDRPAAYRVEDRLYHEYRDGFIFRTWQTRVPVFVGCYR